MADAASVGSDQGNIRHEATLIDATVLRTCHTEKWGGHLESGAGILPAIHTWLYFSHTEILRQLSRQPVCRELTKQS